MNLHAHGIHIHLPHRWEGKIYSRDNVATLHGANFPLPHDDGDYATHALSQMPDSGAMLVITEFDPGSASKGLFAHHQPTALAADEFSSRAMQRTIPGRAGVQRFFTARGRAFCLYCVIATGKHARRRLEQVNEALKTLEIHAGRG